MTYILLNYIIIKNIELFIEVFLYQEFIYHSWIFNSINKIEKILVF